MRAYRGPVLDVIGWRWGLEPADAEDLTQDFFATALAKGWFTRFDPAKARFRTFVRVCAFRFVAKRRDTAGTVVPLHEVDDLATDGDEQADARFRAEWARSVFSLGLGRLRDEAGGERQAHLEVFTAYDLAEADRPTYAQLAERLQLSETQVINHLAWARRRFRHHVLAVMRELAGSDAEFREDVQDLLGVAAP